MKIFTIFTLALLSLNLFAMGNAASSQGPVYGIADHSNQGREEATVCSSRGQKNSSTVTTRDIASKNEDSVLAQ